MAARTTAVVSFAIFFIFGVGCSWRGAVGNGGSGGGCVDNGSSCGVVLKLSNRFFAALAGARFFFGFRPRLLGIGKQWVGTDQVGRSPETIGSTCRNTATPDCCSGSSAVVFMSTPMRRTRSPCCARAASGQATAAAPPSVAKNFRRQSGVPEALFVYSDSVLLGPKVGQRSSVSENSLRVLIGRLAVCVLLMATPFLGAGQVAAEPTGGAPAVRVPGFWDPRRRPEKPDLSRISVIRFLTETNYPPFNFAGPDGNPQGFNVDLARMLCEELKVACTIQMRRFETLIAALNGNQGDAAIASIAATVEMRARVDFTDAYYRTPARFVAKRDSPIDDPLPERLEGKRVAVVAGTAHEAYLKALFTEAEVRAYPSADVARLALRRGDVDLLFGDAISLAFWLNGTDSESCCAFRGGPYIDSRYFGEGIGIAVKKGNDTIRLALNWALFRVWEQGRFTDLWLRTFPISPF
jgi:polar amino acid transport system substrate-binding protein